MKEVLLRVKEGKSMELDGEFQSVDDVESRYSIR